MSFSLESHCRKCPMAERVSWEAPVPRERVVVQTVGDARVGDAKHLKSLTPGRLRHPFDNRPCGGRLISTRASAQSPHTFTRNSGGGNQHEPQCLGYCTGVELPASSRQRIVLVLPKETRSTQPQAGPVHSRTRCP